MRVITVNNSRALVARVEAGTRVAVQSAANQIFTRSKSTVPVDTGALRASARVKPASGFAGQYTAEVLFDQYYAVFVELGTRKMAAQPYLVPAAHATKPKLESDLKRLVGSL
jgi:HK97 gp10 family phage protein